MVLSSLFLVAQKQIVEHHSFVEHCSMIKYYFCLYAVNPHPPIYSLRTYDIVIDIDYRS